MLTPDEDSKISVLAVQGWSMSAIARQFGHDRKTTRAHLQRDRAPDQRSSTQPDPVARFVPYVRARLAIATRQPQRHATHASPAPPRV
jgi:IS30 family transposase